LSENIDRFVITNMRVFRVHGLFSRNLATMPLSRILDITVVKPFSGRIMGYGHFTFESAAKAQAGLLRSLPKSMRRKPALEMLAGMIGAKRGDVSVHSLDLDLLLVDSASPATIEQKDHMPICYVNQGLTRECLFWATGEEHDIEERACKAMGSNQCEFKITIGGK